MHQHKTPHAKHPSDTEEKPAPTQQDLVDIFEHEDETRAPLTKNEPEPSLEKEERKPRKSFRAWFASLLPASQRIRPEAEPTEVHALPDEKIVLKEVPDASVPLPEPPSKHEDVERGLKAIYMSQDGALPDLSHLERTRSKAWLWALVSFGAFLSLLAVAAWLGLFLFQPFREYKGEGLKLAILGPQDVSLGKEETYEIQWSNADASPLSRAEVRVGLPSDFIVTSFDPTLSNDQGRSWQIGLVPTGAQGSFKVHGIFVGALGAQSAIQAIGTYRPLGFDRDFQTLVTQPLAYAKTVLEGRFVTPVKTVAGEPVTLSYIVSNKGERPIQGLVAHISYPIGFVPALGNATSVVSINHEVFLPLDDIAANNSSTVRLAGAFVSGVSGDLVFKAEAGRYGADGSFLPAQKTEGRVLVLAGDLTLRVVVNGSDGDRTIQPGDTLRVAIGYQNTSPEPLKDVAITLGFESLVNGRSAAGTTLLDWSKLEEAHPGVSSTKLRIQTLSYDKKTIPVLEALLPQGEGTIEFSLPTLAAASGTKEALIQMTLQATVPTVGTTKVNRVVKAQSVAMRYRTDADLAVEARYFTEEGAPVGFGPLPPVAGKTTAYLVTWHLSKTLHPLDQVSVSAVLPKIAAWSARVISDAGSVTYDAETRSVKWVLEKVPENVKELEMSFEVQVTPENVDIGRFAALLGETRFQAMDPIVNETVSRTKPPLTTDLQNDEGAKGKGVVRKP